MKQIDLTSLLAELRKCKRSVVWCWNGIYSRLYTDELAPVLKALSDIEGLLDDSIEVIENGIA